MQLQSHNLYDLVIILLTLLGFSSLAIVCKRAGCLKGTPFIGWYTLSIE